MATGVTQNDPVSSSSEITRGVFSSDLTKTAETEANFQYNLSPCPIPDSDTNPGTSMMEESSQLNQQFHKVDLETIYEDSA